MHNKINRFSLYIILLTAFILQVSIIGYVRMFNTVPDLITALVIFFGLFFGWEAGLEAGFAAGLLKDIFSADNFGVNALTLAITGLMIGALSPKFFKESRTTQAFLVFGATLISMIGHYILNAVIFKVTYVSLSEYMAGLIIPSSIYTSILSAVIFPVLIRKFGLKKQEEYL